MMLAPLFPKKFSLALSFACLLPAFGLHADSLPSGAAAYLYRAVGARAIGMGGAFVSLADDANSVYWNPAGLTRMGLPVTEIGSSYSLLPLGQQLAGLNLAQHWEGVGNFGLGVTYFGLGGIQGYDANGNALASFGDQEYAVAASYATNVGYQFELGYTLKGLYQGLGSNQAYGYSMDFGILVQPALGSDLVLGANFQNFLSQLGWDSGEADKVAPNLKIGISNRYFGWHLVVAADLDISVASSGSIAPHLGTEYWIDHAWALRAGYNNGDFNAGLSWSYLFYQFDYAFTFTPSNLGNEHQFSVMLKF